MAALYGAGALSSLLARWSGRLALGVGHLAALAGAVVGLGVFARRSPRRPGAHADPAAPGPLPVRSAFALGGRALGLLPARHLSRGRGGGNLRSSLPPGAR